MVRGHSGAGTTLGVWINGDDQGEATLAASPNAYHLSDSTPVPVQVPAGLAVVRLLVRSGSLTLYSLRL